MTNLDQQQHHSRVEHILIAIADWVNRYRDTLIAKNELGRCGPNEVMVSPAGGGERNAFGKAFAANGHNLRTAAKPGKTGAGDVARIPSGGTGGGYYSSATHPSYGFVPEFGYSNSLMFRIDH